MLWTRSRSYPARRGTLHITLSTKIMLLCRYSAGIRVTLLYFMYDLEGCASLAVTNLSGWYFTSEFVNIIKSVTFQRLIPSLFELWSKKVFLCCDIPLLELYWWLWRKNDDGVPDACGSWTAWCWLHDAPVPEFPESAGLIQCGMYWCVLWCYAYIW